MGDVSSDAHMRSPTLCCHDTVLLLLGGNRSIRTGTQTGFELAATVLIAESAANRVSSLAVL